MMRAGISRVVVEIIILVIAVALALLIFSPISGYIFGSLGRTATVGGASQIQILSASSPDDGTTWTIYAKNLGPGIVTYASTADWKVYIDGASCGVTSPAGGTWNVGTTVTVQCSLSTAVPTTKQHNIVLYGPGGTQAQYLYYPPPS
jgi:hypothetical protein